MMSPTLQEYRCECGKLLFKGFMLISLVEIKCKRCGRVKAIAEINGGFIGPDSYAFLYAIDGTIINASSNASKLIGYSHHELLRMNLFQICQSYTPGIYRKIWDVFQQTQVPIEFDTFQKRKDGKIISMHKQLKFFDLGGQHYVFTIFSHAQGSLQNAELNSHASFIQMDNEMIFFLNPSAVFTHVDPKTPHLLSYNKEEVLGESWFNFFKQPSASEKMFYLMAKNGQSFDGAENHFVDKLGRQIGCENYFSSVFDQKGEFVGYRVFSWFDKPVKTNGAKTNGFHHDIHSDQLSVK